MKTIAITIDEDMITRIDRVISRDRSRGRSRSEVIRRAVGEHLTRLERTVEEDREREIFSRHRRRLEREAKALVKEQAKL